MKITQYAAEIINELNRFPDQLSDEQAESLVDRILAAKQIFVAGAGRSGLMAKAFAMRLMQAGLTAYVVGETITPGIAEGDLLIIGSGSGETKSLAAMAEKAKKLNAAVAAATIFPDSTIGQLADIVVKLPGSPKHKSDGESQTIQPMGSLYEQTLLLFYDAVILRLMEKQGMNGEKMYGRHANLE
jgi:6-phospho-3-hexuloisomerase